MTMIICANCPQYSLLVADRLVSKRSSRGHRLGPWEKGFNKSLVYGCRDALVSLAFAGPAYIDGKSSDHWIAQQLWRENLEANVASFRKSRVRNRLADSLWRLRKALDERPEGRDVEVLVSGYRETKRNVVLPILALWKPTERHLSLRRRPRQHQWGAGWIGSFPNKTELADAILENGGAFFSHTDASKCFRSLIVNASTMNPEIGNDLMEILIDPAQRQITLEYIPGENHLPPQPPALTKLVSGDPIRTPWIIGKNMAFAPMQFYGQQIWSMSICGHKVKIINQKATASGPISAMIPEFRKGPPT